MAAEDVSVLVPWLRLRAVLLLFLVLQLLHPLAMCAQCPRGCSCPGLKEVHCTFRHLTSAPRNLPKDTQKVNLGYNNLQAVGGSEFTHLRHLEMLMLHGNDITAVSPGAFYSLRSLQILKLSYNKLKAVTASMFEGLVGLVRLHLDRNNIDFIEPYTFSGLTSLKLLQLEGNKLRDLHPHSFVTISFLGNFWSSGLRHLHLSDNQLQYLQPRTLQLLGKLELLSLHGNPWTCDCHLLWLLEWNNKHDGVIKCKKEPNAASDGNCVMCSTPQPLNGSQVLRLSAGQLTCERPSLGSPLKNWDSPGWDEADSEPDIPYTRDLEHPLGHLTFILSDNHGNTAHVACDAQRPSESSSMTWQYTRTPGEVTVNVSLTSHLECEVDRDVLQNLWKLVAYYYESPAILEREARKENASRVTYRYSQVHNEDTIYFTDLKGHITAEPAWLLQPRVTLQLNRRQTTTKKLALDFTTFISKEISGRGEEDVPSSWALIQRGNPGRVQSVLEGSEVSLGCTTISSGSQSVEWMMPDLSILDESKSGLALSEGGDLVISNASVSNSGVYHCIIRTENDVDMVPVRLTVKERLLSPNALNGKKMEVGIGESISLPCHVTSTQPSETRWYLPNNQILLPSQPKGRLFVNQNGTLVIKETTHEDTGEYSCLATNLYGVDMLAHMVVVTGEEDSGAGGNGDIKSAGVVATTGESILFLNEIEIEGSGFQEKLRPRATQSPKRVGGRPRHPGRFLRPGMNVKRVKDNKRKQNKSVKELDPNRWAEILAKANAKASTLPPTTQPPHPCVALSPWFKATSCIDREAEVAPSASGSGLWGHQWTRNHSPDSQIIFLNLSLTGQRHKRQVPPTTALPVPTSRLYSTASVLYGSRWHWAPKRTGTALPFPNLMGSGVRPRITTANTVSVSVLAEGDVLLPCEASGEPQPALSWTKVSTGATIQANTKHGQRFEVLKNGTFVIKNVQLQDRGQYLCTAQNTFGSDRIVITVAVQTQPPKIIDSHSTEVQVYLGKPISIDCVASGKPQAQISWILPDRTFVRDVGDLDRPAVLLPNGTLRIQSANFSSKGDYKCIASNAAGADTVTRHIHVAALPPAIGEEASESVAVHPGRSVYVHCTARAEPAPVLKWGLPSGLHVKPSQFLGRRLFVFPNGTLYIKNISPADSGRYECSATNPVGVARRVLHLSVRQEVPGPRQTQQPSQQHRVTAMYGSTVYLHCPVSTGSPRGTLWQLPSKRLLEHRYR
ncbi:hypothetical protein DPEC_G00023540 [Dallia pectoralis]|uniref:Uncharacterized protein n=1 Tax=Dallia pectoralis TaxID=75939 RepID=A0ACC2HI90_DALPE|nr:hypothetical protein DPEC_G00023540 [Dallia pectoralis]